MSTLVLLAALVLPLAASPQAEPDAGVEMDAILRRLGALEDEVARLKAPAVVSAPVEPIALDVAAPPFSRFDWTWMNGSNYQPSSLLRIGPVTPTFFVDVDSAWQFSNPVDHTIFPTTTAPRHSEFSLNLAYLGFELNGLNTKFGGPIGRLELQMGSYIATIHGQDSTLGRGYFLSNPALSYVKQAGAGWHFHWRHGLNIELGIFPSYIALESYVPQENWGYTHPFVSDFTPYYFSGLRTQLFFTENQKLELWLVNGWQSFGRWHDALAGGYLYNLRRRVRGDGRLQTEPLAVAARRVHPPGRQPTLLLGDRRHHGAQWAAARRRRCAGRLHTRPPHHGRPGGGQRHAAPLSGLDLGR